MGDEQMKYRVIVNKEGLKELQITITEKNLKSLVAKSDERIDDDNYSAEHQLTALGWSITAGAMLNLIEKNV
jgi:hypothetical protein